MKVEYVKRALYAVGLKPSTSRLLVHMADVCDEAGLFYESRARTAHQLGMHADTIKAALAELRAAGYVSSVLDARKGRHPRHVQLHPEQWRQPEPFGAEAPPRQTGPALAREAMRAAADRCTDTPAGANRSPPW